MSDRRSFSEIPAELLREHGVDARVDRVWERLAKEVSPTRRKHRGFGGSASMGLAAVAFVAGVVVGVHWVGREPAPLAALGAEPASAPRPTLPAAEPTRALSRAGADAPRTHQTRRVPIVHRTESVEPSQLEAAEPVIVARAAPPEWQRLADDGQYAQALAALEAGGGFDAALRDASADQLMALVDVARATGQRDRAIVALRRVVSEHGADPNAPVAAWMLGSELAKVGDLASAEQAFAMYRALSPGGDFAEDALARQIDLAAEQGNLEHAHKLAGQYLKEFPDGPRTADIQARMEQWGREPSPSRTEQGPLSAVPDGGAPR